ncbi:MAG: HAD-IA family hydrolase [Actinobacteria bacterium]|nr:HAD-IA family hydrolase [Actinomycetota bacterium]
MSFRAVFFDAGETLVHPEPSFPELFARITAREGHEVDPPAVVEASKVVLQRFSEAADDRELWTTSPERSRGFWMPVYERMLETLAVPDGERLAQILYSEFTDRANYGIFGDVEPALDALESGGTLLGVVSNFEAWLEDLLGELRVRDRFPVRVISGIEGIEKPDPRIYELALERAGVAAVDAAYVGDNPEFDVDPPSRLGMFAVLIDRRGRHEGFPGTRITDMRQLPEVLG